MILTTPHLEAQVVHLNLDEQPGRLDIKRLQEVDTLESRLCRRRSPCHLKVADSREEDATLHHMIGYEVGQRTLDGRVECNGSIRSR